MGYGVGQTGLAPWMDHVAMWSQVWAGLIGGGLALVGVLVAQRQTTRRDDARWAREVARQDAQWRREDAARSYEHRREAYMAFMASWQGHYDGAFYYRLVEEGPLPDFDWLDELHKLHLAIEVFGSPDAIAAAAATMKNLDGYGQSDDELDYDLFKAYQAAVRADLVGD